MMEEGTEWGWDVDGKTYGFAMVDKLTDGPAATFFSAMSETEHVSVER